MILATLANEVRHFSNMFLALQKFALKEDRLDLECHDYNLMTKRDFDYKDICGKFETMPGFHFYITATSSVAQKQIMIHSGSIFVSGQPSSK